MNKPRKNSIGFCGGAYGDEGKGRFVDEYVHKFAKKGKVVLYRDNGGSNAGHTVAFDDVKLALHQLPSGVFVKNVVCVLGKGMVLNPNDLLMEIEEVKKASGGKIIAEIKIDAMAALSLDTHRAFETA
ncbi:MAG TPA: adenylosuccinate synthetase, partial [Candidatus Dojkabacteria bacterium]|nr:adenylosuccinate synthetase [Candidatus Dojkabacteria bacterium]